MPRTAGGTFTEDPNLFFAVAIVQPGRDPGEAEQALLAELDRLRDEPVSDHGLERVKNQLARDFVRPRVEPAEGGAVGPRVVIHKGDATRADGDFDMLMGTRRRTCSGRRASTSRRKTARS